MFINQVKFLAYVSTIPDAHKPETDSDTKMSKMQRFLTRLVSWGQFPKKPFDSRKDYHGLSEYC
jgi:hypothetical protein